jgi:predicted amino acid dehydrogenase
MNFSDEDRCVEHQLNRKRVESIARRISKAAMEAEKMGLKIFGGSGTGTLRVFGKGQSGEVARLYGQFDGGDGGDEY